MNELYVDGIGQIHYVSNMIRMDLITVSPNPSGDGDVVPEVKQRVLLTSNGFIGMMNTMQKLADKLVENGVFTKDDGGNEAEVSNSITEAIDEKPKKTRKAKK